MRKEFLENTSLIRYSLDFFDRKVCEDEKEVNLGRNDETINWLNTYGLDYQEESRKIIHQENLDDFLMKLLADREHSNKVIELDPVLFIAIRVLKTDEPVFSSEQMFFIASMDFVWSIQERHGDYFNWIRERLEMNVGIIRKKKADYLLFLILESIIDNYQLAYQKNAVLSGSKGNLSEIKPSPEFTAQIESRKEELFNFQRASTSLRDTIVKLEKVEIDDFNANYFSELKEQISNLITDIEFELQGLESKLNLIFSIQGHRLNEVMKMLTIFSVIFIPLTFLAGIYGMNFKYMPELNTKYGYFVLLGVMALVTLISIWYFSRKKWF
ncbi:MAG: magnesium and cobalt transport protein CorA [Bacteroidetes bacterium]|nr:MAG: magnesium and cobalt transport protein CorA [Bacteroidota bacterium]